eukprot:TRINITY_DN1011_c0_g3_i1.p5 TRINITY_DN1011_c0_g3~~TRINITY_DN1011_c0_g3_i1.p5  ORF type:complete len:563 (-),score=101.97 TRINITY_DN1011_c0_g3_i1:19089-20702(-)
MKKNIASYSLMAAMFTLAFVSCDDSSELTNIEKEIPEPVLNKYETVVSGPKDIIETAEATIHVNVGDYYFSLAGVHTDSGENISDSKELFSIDEESGKISIKTTENKSASELATGRYYFSVGVGHIGGVSVFDSIATIDIMELPFTIAYSTNEFDLAFGQLGEFATVNVTSDDETMEVLSYELTSEPEGITIDENTGALSKGTKNVAAGTHQLSVRVKTNQGVKTFSNLVEITVGSQPQLFYTNAGTEFSSVSVSSWSGFTAAIGGPTQDLGTGLSYQLATTDINGLSIDAATGEITLAEDSNLAEGTYNVSISVVDTDGFEVGYADLFAINVVNTWEAFAFDDVDISSYAEKEIRPVNDQFAEYETVMLNGSAAEFVSYKHLPDPGTGFLPYGFSYNFGKATQIDALLLREIDMDGTFRKMKVSFGETSVSKIQADGVKRLFYYGYSRTELIDNANFVDAEWNLLIADDSDKWAVNNYKTDFKNIETEFVIDDPAQDKLYLQWRVQSTMPATGYTRGCLNAINIQVMKKTSPVFAN